MTKKTNGLIGQTDRQTDGYNKQTLRDRWTARNRYTHKKHKCSTSVCVCDTKAQWRKVCPFCHNLFQSPSCVWESTEIENKTKVKLSGIYQTFSSKSDTDSQCGVSEIEPRIPRCRSSNITAASPYPVIDIIVQNALEPAGLIPPHPDSATTLSAHLTKLCGSGSVS